MGIAADYVLTGLQDQAESGEYPGMRVTVDPKQPNPLPDPWNWEVFLDGDKQRMCITADEERGYVDVALLDEHGKPVPKGKLWLQRRKFGKVQIFRKKVRVNG